MHPKLPAFESVLKGRAVEDPINLWLHRPLAYLFVMAVYRTRITPNQITLISLLVGLAAAFCFVDGAAEYMLLGGILLWLSAILDGADGILARAKKLHSEAGRAIDGIADAIVAVMTVGAAFYHIWIRNHDLTQLAWMPFALGTAFIHVYTYDYYKESYLLRTRRDWDGRPERARDIADRLERLISTNAAGSM
jgi:phosphatidylglycerophosphate synthase